MTPLGAVVGVPVSGGSRLGFGPHHFSVDLAGTTFCLPVGHTLPPIVLAIATAFLLVKLLQHHWLTRRQARRIRRDDYDQYS